MKNEAPVLLVEHSICNSDILKLFRFEIGLVFVSHFQVLYELNLASLLINIEVLNCAGFIHEVVGTLMISEHMASGTLKLVEILEEGLFILLEFNFNDVHDRVVFLKEVEYL